MIIDMSLNASGVRDTARSLHICPNTVLRELKKKEMALESVNTSLLRTLNPAEVTWDVERAGEAEAEMDEMWSFVGNKGNPRWLWHAIDHCTGKVLAYVFGRRQDTVFLKLKALLEPFGLTRYYTDYWGAYTRHLDPDVHSPGKRNTQKIERKHLTLRTRIKRLVRKTICLSENDTDARHRHWLVCQPLCLWTGSVTGIISTFETLPLRNTRNLCEPHKIRLTKPQVRAKACCSSSL